MDKVIDSFIKNVLETIKEIIILIVIIGIATALIDYSRMSGGEIPIFNLKEYNSKTNIQTFRGLFYEASRKIHVSEDEPLIDSSNMKYQIDLYFYHYELQIPEEFRSEKFEFVLLTTPTANCTSTSQLYYADEKTKFYTYCFDSVKLKEQGSSKSQELIEYLKKDGSIVEDIVMNMSYVGLAEDGTTQKFKTTSDAFANNGLTMYRCHKINIDDVYIAPAETPMQSDFCTYKDDDWDWLWIVEQTEDDTELTEAEKIPYPFMEDEINRYEFSNQRVMSQTYIVRKAIRGRDEVRIPLREALDSGNYSLEELTKRGLKYNTINKEEEQRKLEEERNKEQESVNEENEE